MFYFNKTLRIYLQVIANLSSIEIILHSTAHFITTATKTTDVTLWQRLAILISSSIEQCAPVNKL
jgi:hypothetical protein